MSLGADHMRIPGRPGVSRRRAAALALCAIALCLAIPTAAAGSAYTAATTGATLVAAAGDTTVGGSADDFVLDEADVVSSDAEERINQLGTAIEAATPGAEIAVLTVETLEGLEVEEFANERFRELGIGSAEEDNGVLLVVAIEERKVRIEVGYGLEGAIPDSKAGRLLDEYALPSFKEGDYSGGIESVYTAIAREVAAEYDVEMTGDLEVLESQPSDPGGNIAAVLVFVAVLLFVGFLLARFGKFSGPSGGSGSSGGGFGGGGFGGGSSGGGGASRGW